MQLASDLKRDHIAVIRGKKGVTQTISIYKLVVGDIVLLEQGCLVPADCVLVEGKDIIVNETMYSDDRTREAKSVVTPENFANQRNPFLFSNSFVT